MVGLGLGLVCSKVGLIEVWGLDLILGFARIKFGIKVFGCGYGKIWWLELGVGFGLGEDSGWDIVIEWG